MSKEALRSEAYEMIDKIIDYVTEPRFNQTSLIAPQDGQAVWVRHRNGAEYRMTYPFNHEDYPFWYPLPKD